MLPDLNGSPWPLELCTDQTNAIFLFENAFWTDLTDDGGPWRVVTISLDELRSVRGLCTAMVALCLVFAQPTEASEIPTKGIRDDKVLAADASREAAFNVRLEPHQAVHPFASVVATAAASHQLPLDFFERLIWQESRFNPQAISTAGAQGIAQFMPGTAQWRGLADPFDPPQALDESARWLRELWIQFGNLGLAAAAYNAGPERVLRWLSGRATLPSETRHYVRIVTGQDAESWSRCGAKIATDEEPEIPCPEIARPVSKVASPKTTNEGNHWGPWGLQLTGDWSELKALSEFHKMQGRFPRILGDRKPIVLKSMRGSWAIWYRVRIAEATRDRATDLCTRLERAGGKCLVLRN